MKKVPATLAALAVMMPLSGCQSFIGAFDFGNHSRSAQPVFGEADLEEGRRMLADGNIGNAIPAFQRAALNRETAPQAANGLAVAYARLGRGDLAERYFKAAVTLDPHEPKFAANLERFYNSPLAQDMRTLNAQREEASKAFAKFQQSEEAIRPEPVSEQRVVTSGGQQRRITLERGARSQRVALGSSTPATPQTNSRVTMGKVDKAPTSAPMRVRVGGTQLFTNHTKRPAELHVQQSANYPVRVRIGKDTKPERAASADYPMRVSLRDRPATKASD